MRHPQFIQCVLHSEGRRPERVRHSLADQSAVTSGARIRGASRARGPGIARRRFNIFPRITGPSRVLTPITPTVLAGCARRGAPIGATHDGLDEEIEIRRTSTSPRTFGNQVDRRQWRRSTGGPRRADTRGERDVWRRAIIRGSICEPIKTRRPVMAGTPTSEGVAGEPGPARPA